MTYDEQLSQPEWQKRRLEIISAAGYKCSLCGDTEETLQVHHRVYYSGRMAWEYTGNELVCLCVYCHEEQHDRYEMPMNEPLSVPTHQRGGPVHVSEVLRNIFDDLWRKMDKAA